MVTGSADAGKETRHTFKVSSLQINPLPGRLVMFILCGGSCISTKLRASLGLLRVCCISFVKQRNRASIYGGTQEEQENRGPCEDPLALSQVCEAAPLGGSLGIKCQHVAQVILGDREPRQNQSVIKFNANELWSLSAGRLLPLAMDDVIGSRWRLGFSAAGASGDASAVFINVSDRERLDQTAVSQQSI